MLQFTNIFRGVMPLQWGLEARRVSCNLSFHSKRCVLGWGLLLAHVMLPTPALGQSQAVSFKAGYSDFRFDQVARSFVTEGGGLVQLIQAAFAGTAGIGGEFLQFFKNHHLMVTASAEYRSADLFGGSGGFTAKYAPHELGPNPDWESLPGVEVKDATSYFRSTLGFGVSPIGGDGLFLFLAPNFDMQYGQRVYMEDAYRAFEERGYSQPGDFKVERSLLVGGGIRVHAGVWLTDSFGLMFSPGAVWSYRFDETYQGYEYQGAEFSGMSFGYEFSFGLVSKTSR